MFCKIEMTNIQHAVTKQAPFKVTYDDKILKKSGGIGIC